MLRVEPPEQHNYVQTQGVGRLLSHTLVILISYETCLYSTSQGTITYFPSNDLSAFQ